MRKSSGQSIFNAAVLLAATLGAQAQQTYTWDNGAETHVWSTSANWVGDPSLIFGTTTDIIFDSDSVVKRSNAVSIGGGKTIRSLTINADYETSNNATFDIRTYKTFGGTANANLAFTNASGNASITVAQSTSGTAMVRLGSSNGGSVVLDSSLDLAQNNTYFNTTGFQFDGSVSGAGAINKTGAGLVRMVRDNANWSGGMNINQGEVSVFSHVNAMGTGAWTLGGGANNTTFSVGSVAVQDNSGGITVADGDGTRTIALMSSTDGNPTLAGDITLNKDTFFDVEAYVAVTHDRLTATGAISGTGGIVKTGTGILQLDGINTYRGDTSLSVGDLLLSDDAGLTFVIGEAEVNNKLTGAGDADLAGDFYFDLAFAGTTVGDSWTIEDLAGTVSYDTTFSVNSFADAGGGLWTTSANGADYEFSESTGVLTVIPEPATIGMLGLGALITMVIRRKLAR
jgi:autotransporter-associated beta strand protein